MMGRRQQGQGQLFYEFRLDEAVPDDRLVWKIRALLELSWAKRRNVMPPHGWLFPGRSVAEPVSTRQINRAVHEAAEAAGIRKRVSPHTLRHSFATHLLEQDVDIRVIQVLLGHSKLDTTALYARVATKTIRSVTSPLEHLKLLMEGESPGA
jgi:integrase/recombinase XerD